VTTPRCLLDELLFYGAVSLGSSLAHSDHIVDSRAALVTFSFKIHLGANDLGAIAWKAGLSQCHLDGH